MAALARVTRTGWIAGDDASSFARVTRNGWVALTAAAGGDVSVAITGNAATVSVGTISPALSVALTGNQSTVSLGSIAAAVSVALSGVSATISVGNVSASAGGDVSVNLTGVSLSVSVGTIVPALSLALTGNSATASAGSVSPSTSVRISGVSGTGAVGSVTASGGTPVAPKRNYRRTRYTPGVPPAEVGALRQFLREELERINNAFESPATHLLLEKLNVEPERQLDGKAYIAYADGTNWDPGSGEGVYAYYSGAWHKLG